MILQPVALKITGGVRSVLIRPLPKPTWCHRFMMHEAGVVPARMAHLGGRLNRKRRETSWTGPVERDVLARIRRPLKLEAERIDGTDR